MSMSSASIAALLLINIDSHPIVKANGIIEYQKVLHMMQDHGFTPSTIRASNTLWYIGALCINTIKVAIPITNS